MHDLIMLKCAKLQCAFCIFFKMIMPTTSIHLNILFTKYVHRTFDFVNFFSPAQGMFRHFQTVLKKNQYIILPIINTYLAGDQKQFSYGSLLKLTGKKTLQQRTFTQRCKTFYLINQVKSSAKKRFVEYLLCIVFREAKHTLWVCMQYQYVAEVNTWVSG